MAKSVLVLDGETRAALAVVRSLGRRSLRVIVAAYEHRSLAGVSRYATAFVLSPHPLHNPNAYQDWLLRTTRQIQPTFVIPVTNVSLELALAHESELRSLTILPFGSQIQYAAVADKATLVASCLPLGVRVPITLKVHRGWSADKEIQAAIRKFAYPACLKPAQSDIFSGEKYIKIPASYPRNAEDVFATLDSFRQSENTETQFLLQQYIQGSGIGFFALCSAGEIVSFFSHRRLLEKPPTGGASVLSESIEPPAEVFQAAKKLLRHFAWTGVAMIEFKEADDGFYYLIEVNPRFWGSLQLAVDCGADFPYLLCALYTQSEPLTGSQLQEFAKTIRPYQVGNRLLWLLGTIDHVLIRLKQDPIAALRSVMTLRFLQFFTRLRQTRLEVCRFDDIHPFQLELRTYLSELFRRLFPQRS